MDQLILASLSHTRFWYEVGMLNVPINRVWLPINSMFARLGTDYEIRNQWFFVILEAMATD